jgi:ABC-type antimicrobial peptide transport system permease subunit
MREFLIFVATCLGLIAIVPLMVWGGTGSWRHALHALKQYAGILVGFVVVGGGLALVMVLGEFI